MKNRFSNLWKYIVKEKGLIILCALLAFLAWQGIRKTIGFEVPVSNILVDVDVPEGWAVWEKSVHRVNVLFRGSREDIRYLNNEQLRVIIPVPNPEYGEEIIVKLTDKFLRNPTGAKVVQFSPSEIVIKLDQESERLLPIKASVNGSLPEGLQIDRIICTPASVRVSGARQVLDGMESIHTAPVELKDRQTSFKESVPVALPESSRLLVKPDWVSVEFSLIERSSTQFIENIPIQVVCNPGERRHIKIMPPIVNISVKGLQQQIEQIKAENIFAYVNCTDLNENTTYDLPISVNTPDGVHLIETDPAFVKVVISN